MKLPFWKMHGAGNDFILIDDRAGGFPAGKAALIAALCARRTGIGSDGLILLDRSASAHVRMRFFNPDGHPAEMCGNGARCAARLAHELGAAPADLVLETAAGPVPASVRGNSVAVRLTPPAAWRLDGLADLPGGAVRYGFVNTGVPHAVVLVEDLASCDVAGLGRSLRRHAAFAPAGTNVNFVRLVAPNTLEIRTYERGVEGETLACGTGIAAAALILARRGAVQPPVSVRTAGGDTLQVAFDIAGDRVDNVVLTGPAVHVFQGEAEV